MGKNKKVSRISRQFSIGRRLRPAQTSPIDLSATTGHRTSDDGGANKVDDKDSGKVTDKAADQKK